MPGPCPFPVVNYTPPGPRQHLYCCPTARSIIKWITERGPKFFYENGCLGYKMIQGTTTPSVHGTGRAIDCSIRSQPGNNPTYASLQALMTLTIDTYLTPQACNLGIQRMIFNRKVWNSSQATIPWASWNSFTGPQSHADHIHLEITPAYCDKYTIADINFIFGVIGNPSLILGNVNSGHGSQVPVVTPPVGSGTGGTLTGSGGGTGVSTVPPLIPVPPLTPANMGAVWSASIPASGPCVACGGQFGGLNTDPQVGTVTGIIVTYCGGTGAICIEMATGAVCTTGTAPPIANFPGPIKSFIWWGNNGGYALSQDGMTIYAAGGASVPVFTVAGPWNSLYGINPTTIGVSAPATVGFKSDVATVNSIALATCC